MRILKLPAKILYYVSDEFNEICKNVFLCVSIQIAARISTGKSDMAVGYDYSGSENKGADQLRGYREADLRLCFRICKKPVFPRRGSFYLWYSKHYDQSLEFYYLLY